MCNCWFELATVRRQIWGNDHLSCGFGLRRSLLALKWTSDHSKVRFRWGAVTRTFHVNFIPTEAHTFDPYWFYCLKWGCNNLFFQECLSEENSFSLFGMEDRKFVIIFHSTSNKLEITGNVVGSLPLNNLTLNQAQISCHISSKLFNENIYPLIHACGMEVMPPHIL